MEVSIKRRDHKAIIAVEFRNGFAGNYIYEFINNCEQDCYAGLAVEAIQINSAIMLRQSEETLTWTDIRTAGVTKKRNRGLEIASIEQVIDKRINR